MNIPFASLHGEKIESCVNLIFISPYVWMIVFLRSNANVGIVCDIFEVIPINSLKAIEDVSPNMEQFDFSDL